MEAQLPAAEARELQDWASIWADLMHVESIVDFRQDLPATPLNIFVRRGLWEAALVSYGRTVNSGRRRGMQKLVSDFTAEELGVHEALLSWRNRHVAHRVDPRREGAFVRGLVEAETEELRGVRIHVNPAFGPDEEEPELEKAFKALVYRVRNEIWQKYMEPLKERLLSPEMAEKWDLAPAPKLPTERGVWLSLDI